MDMQNVSNLQIPEGVVRTIHDKDNRLIWGRVAYNTKYAGDTVQDGTPTPDAPVPVQVVSSAQTVTISDGVDSQTYAIDLAGKNLLDITTFENGYINPSGTVSAGGGTNAVFGFMPVLPETDYTVSVQNNSFAMAIAYYDSNKTLISRVTNDYVARTSRTFTTPQNCAYARAGFYASSGASQSIMENSLPQFEKGSSATPYAPYYNYELCKIGDYQDYIYKSGDDWYVHKATARVDVSSLTGWFASGSYAYKTRNGMSDVLPASSDSATAVGLCNAFSASTTNLVYSGSVDYGFALPAAGGVGILIRNKNVASLADFTTYLSNNPVYGYFALATPTDTKITDATLLGQLNAVHEWFTRYGYNATVSGNLPLIVDRTNL